MSIRCDVTRVVQESGEKPDKEPLKWLSKKRPPRPDTPQSTTFGINAVTADLDVGRTLHPGDIFKILSEKAGRTECAQ